MGLIYYYVHLSYHTSCSFIFILIADFNNFQQTHFEQDLIQSLSIGYVLMFETLGERHCQVLACPPTLYTILIKLLYIKTLTETSSQGRRGCQLDLLSIKLTHSRGHQRKSPKNLRAPPDTILVVRQTCNPFHFSKVTGYFI